MTDNRDRSAFGLPQRQIRADPPASAMNQPATGEGREALVERLRKHGTLAGPLQVDPIATVDILARSCRLAADFIDSLASAPVGDLRWIGSVQALAETSERRINEAEGRAANSGVGIAYTEAQRNAARNLAAALEAENASLGDRVSELTGLAEDTTAALTDGGSVSTVLAPPTRDVSELIEASSLGTPEAVALRASVPAEVARDLVARANASAAPSTTPAPIEPRCGHDVHVTLDSGERMGQGVAWGSAWQPCAAPKGQEQP